MKPHHHFYHEPKKYKKKSKTHKLINNLIYSTDEVLVQGVSSTCITLIVTRVGLVIVPISIGIGAGFEYSVSLIVST